MIDQMPAPTHYTISEGGVWHKWPPNTYSGYRLHAVRFDTGVVFDAYNGWRPQKLNPVLENEKQRFAKMQQEDQT